ncbi:MAG: flavodoxin family protein [Desulfonatronovibrionaceae bacterium]
MASVVEGMEPEARLMGIGGSPRQKGNSDLLLKHILQGADQAGIVTASLQLRELEFKPCLGCEKCRKDKICTGLTDGMTSLYPLIYQSRGLVLVSPVHNYNITSWMKAFIDRLYCFYEFEDKRPGNWSTRMQGQGRKAVLAAVAEQEDEYDLGFTLDAMQRPLEALGYEIVGRLPVLGVFHRAGVQDRQKSLDEAEKLGNRLARRIAADS